MNNSTKHEVDILKFINSQSLSHISRDNIVNVNQFAETQDKDGQPNNAIFVMELCYEKV